jgi:hypothetical protein
LDPFRWHPDFGDEVALREYVKSHLGVDDLLAAKLIELYRRWHLSASRLDTMLGASTAIFRNL